MKRPIKKVEGCEGFDLEVYPQREHYDYRTGTNSKYDVKVTIMDHPSEEDNMGPGDLKRDDYIKSGDVVRCLEIVKHKQRKYVKVRKADGKEGYFHCSKIHCFMLIVDEQKLVEYRQNAFYPKSVQDGETFGTMGITNHQLLKIAQDSVKQRLLGWVGEMHFLTENSTMISQRYCDDKMNVYELRFHLYPYVTNLDGGFKAEMRVGYLTKFKMEEEVDPVDIVRLRQEWHG